MAGARGSATPPEQPEESVEMMAEKPTRTDADLPTTWDHVTDMLVIGFGGAGAAAALQGRESGLDVIVVDRFDGGGATGISGGVIYAGGTSFQKEAGYDDGPEAMFDYLSLEYQGCVRPETLRRFCEGSAGDVAWLAGHGVPFSSALIPGKTAYPPDDKYLYHSGNEKVASYSARAKPAPRGHRTVGTGFTGYVFFAKLREAVDRAGATFLPHMSAVRLLQDAAGRIVGAEMAEIPDEYRAEHERLYARVNPMAPFNGPEAEKAIAEERELVERVAVRRFIQARQGVVISTGGFVYNLELLRKHRSELADNQAAMLRLGTMGCNGSGIALGESVGGATGNMDSAYVGRLIAPPNQLIKGIAVNRNGDRFINEEIYCGFLGDAIARQPDATAWLIQDRRGFWKVVRECFNFDKALFKIYLVPTLMNLVMGGTKRARSIETLAKKLGMPVQRLEASIAANNAAAAGEGEDAFAKSSGNLQPIGKGPFYAINLSTNNKFSFTQLFTLGGLKVDEESGNVVRPDGSRIDGLYAAGRAAVGLCSIGYVSGMSIADAVFSGRRAARSIGAAAQGRSAAAMSTV